MPNSTPHSTTVSAPVLARNAKGDPWFFMKTNRFHRKHRKNRPIDTEEEEEQLSTDSESSNSTATHYSSRSSSPKPPGQLTEDDANLILEEDDLAAIPALVASLHHLRQPAQDNSAPPLETYDNERTHLNHILLDANDLVEEAKHPPEDSGPSIDAIELIDMPKGSSIVPLESFETEEVAKAVRHRTLLKIIHDDRRLTNQKKRTQKLK